MKKNIKKACDEYEKMILDATEYTGNTQPEKKIFSASSLGNYPLQNFLKFKYGSKKSTQFEANTFGSVYQLGIDSATNSRPEYKLKYTNAMRIKVKLPNGWTVSGEMDQIDWDNEVIFDNKVTTGTAIGKVKTEGKDHQYALQMGVYKWLLKEDAIQKEEKVIPFDAVLPMVDKNFSYFKTNKYNQLNFIEVETHSHEEIERLLKKATDELQTFIDLNTEPPKCENTWNFGKKGQRAKPMRCIHYCDVAEHCKHFNPTDTNVVRELLDL